MYVADNIMPCEMIATELKKIQTFLESPYAVDNPAICAERAADIESFMAFSGKLYADAKYRLNEMTDSTIMKGLKELAGDKMSATILKQYVSSKLKDYEFLVDWAERVNRATTHSLDMSRTMISKHKAEMEYIRYSPKEGQR